MLNIPESVKALFKKDGVHKNLRIHFPNAEMPDITNENIVKESLRFTESICSQNTFRFGLAEASVLEFETVGVGNMYGMTIEASIEIDTTSLTAAQISAIQAGTWDGELVLAADSDIGFGFFRVPLGTFRIESCPRNHGAMAHRMVTAYTETVEDTDLYPGFPQKTFIPSFEMKPSIALRQLSGIGCTEMSSVTMSSGSGLGQSWLYDSSGNRITVSLVDSNDTSKFTKATLCSPTNHEADFGLVSGVTGEYPLSVYYSIGEAIAEKLDRNSVDLTYDATGNRVYESNKDALLALTPWFFYPCAYMYVDEIESGGSSYTSANGLNSVRINPNMLFPIIGGTYSGASDNFIKHDAEFANGGKTLGSSNFVATAIAVDPSDVLSVKVSVVASATSNTYNLGLTGIEIPRFTVRRFTCDNGGTPYISFNLPFTIKGEKDSTVKIKSAENANRTFTLYRYDNFKVHDLIVDMAELEGVFIKPSRIIDSGKLFKVVRLSSSSPTAVSVGDYSSAWWDEYDVESVGQLLLRFNINGTVTDYAKTISIGSNTGSSVYDMTENEVLPRIVYPDIDEANNRVSSGLRSALGDLAFTPTELSMQGWPWIEAGDALQITAEDGTVVDTYALRIEMEGIQHMTARITADGGEIIGRL